MLLILFLLGLLLLVTLIELKVLAYAYKKLGISRRYVFLVLLFSLFRSGTDITIATHMVARPVPGIGIAMPVSLPLILAALLATRLDRSHSATIA